MLLCGRKEFVVYIHVDRVALDELIRYLAALGVDLYSLGADILIHQPLRQQRDRLYDEFIEPLPGVVFGYCETFHSYSEFIIESRSTKKMRPLRALVMPPWSVEWLPLITGITFHMPVVTESAL